MKKSIIFLLFMYHFCALAQLDPYQWRIGFGVGYSNYFGDVGPNKFNGIDGLVSAYYFNNTYNSFDDVQLSLERKISKSLSIQLAYGRHSISMSDRYKARNGNMNTSSINFERALNFKTEINDVGLNLLYRFDNNRMLRNDAFVAPFVGLGIGLIDFTVYGDLRDDNENFYDYASLSPINNGNYETNLTALNVESDAGYNTTVAYFNSLVGLRFKLGYHWELALSSSFRFTQTDFLDDVGGNYRQNFNSSLQAFASNPGNVDPQNTDGIRKTNNQNDFYIFNGISLKFSFGQAKNNFKPPRVLSFGVDRPTDKNSIFDVQLEEDSLENAKKTSDFNNREGDFASNQIEIDQSELFDTILKELFEIDKTTKLNQLDLHLIPATKNLNEIKEKEQTLDTIISKIEADSALNDSTKKLKILPFEADLKEFNTTKDSLKNHVDSLETIRKNILEKEYSSNKDLLVKAHFYLNGNSNFSRENSDEIAGKKSGESEIIRSRDDDFYYELIRSQTTRDSLIIALLNQRPTEQTASSPKRSNTTIVNQASAPNNAGEISGLKNEISTLKTENNAQFNELKSALNVLLKNDSIAAAKEFSKPNQYTVTKQKSIDDLEKSLAENEKYYSNQHESPRFKSSENSSENEAKNEDRLKQQELEIAKQLTVISALQKELQAAQKTGKSDTLVHINKPSESETQSANIDSKEAVPMENKMVGNKVNVLFAINSTELSSRAISLMEGIMQELKQSPNARITLTAYADNTGDIDYNMQLCKKRSETVKQWFLNSGIDANRIETNNGGVVVKSSNQASNGLDRKVEILLKR